MVDVAFVVVAFVNTALVAEILLDVLLKAKEPPIPTLPVMVALLAVKFATVVEPAVSVPKLVAPETESESAERLVALTDAPEIEPPVRDEFEIATLPSWSILFVCAVTV